MPHFYLPFLGFCRDAIVVPCTVSTGSLSDKHTPHPPFQRPSADYSMRYADNFDNFLSRFSKDGILAWFSFSISYMSHYYPPPCQGWEELGSEPKTSCWRYILQRQRDGRCAGYARVFVEGIRGRHGRVNVAGNRKFRLNNSYAVLNIYFVRKKLQESSVIFYDRECCFFK
jgi:hypothetical protein